MIGESWISNIPGHFTLYKERPRWMYNITMNDNQKIQNETLIIERFIDAPVDRAWQAWTSANLVEQWWQTSSVEQTIVDEYDFRPGGVWRQHAVLDSGISVGENNPGVEFVEIVPRQRIVTKPRPIEGDSVELVPDLQQTVIAFDSLDDGRTRISISAIRNSSDDWQPGELQLEVYSEVLDNLASFVAQP